MFLVDLYHTPRRKWLNLDDHAQTAWENIGKKENMLVLWYISEKNFCYSTLFASSFRKGLPLFACLKTF